MPTRQLAAGTSEESVVCPGERIADRQIDRQTDRQTNKQTDRQTDKQTNRQTDRPTDRQTDGRTEGRTDRARERKERARILINTEYAKARKAGRSAKLQFFQQHWSVISSASFASRPCQAFSRLWLFACHHLSGSAAHGYWLSHHGDHVPSQAQQAL